MIIAIPKENFNNESRVSCPPSSVKELIKNGYEVHFETGCGLASSISDDDYKSVGAKLMKDNSTLYQESDIILRVNYPSLDEIKLLKRDSTIISFFQSTGSLKEVQALKDKNITGFSMHLVPRTTLAQKMDALSSQANIAGYKSVLMAASRLGIYMPLLMTAAGTIRPAKVLILGAGVAGLQAIATAKRLGAQVEVFDVRPVVKEQVESLGARFIELPEVEEKPGEAGGYAKAVTPEFLSKQKATLTKYLSEADVAICTAQVLGKKAPVLIDSPMIEKMRPGAVVIDLAVAQGGNCEGTKANETIIKDGVKLIGAGELPSSVPYDASSLYAKNLTSLITPFIKDGLIKLDKEDELISGCLLSDEGVVLQNKVFEN